MGETIHEGWLVKSPPDKKSQTLPRFFQAKWRRRYFVLHAPPASDRLPGNSNCVLDYFKDHTKSKKKGTIDLDQCEEITSALDSAHYEHLFALRSKHKGQDRTYYLAADSEPDMTKWVECLCNVCGCKPVPDQNDDLPPGAGGTQSDSSEWPMLPAPTPQGTPNRYYEGTPTRAQTVRNQPTSQMTPPPRASPSVRSVGHNRSPATRYGGQVGNGSAPPVRQVSTEEYFPIWESETRETKSSPAVRGKGTSPLDKVPPAPGRTVRHDSVDSIPDMDAPPPPVKQGSTPGKTGSMAIHGDYDPDQTYDHPSKSYTPAQYVNMDTMDSPPRRGAGDLYQVPPPRPHQRVNIDDGVYKVPPARYTHQSQLGIRGTNATDSFYQVPPPAKGTPVRQSHDMFYDVPPSRPGRDQVQRNSNSSNESRSSQKGSDSAYGSEDFYDHPPMQRAPDPPGGAAVTQITRQLRTTEIRSTAASVISQGDVYDVPPPRKTHSDENILERVPPPPKPPKGGSSVFPEEQGPYLNLPPNSKAHPGAPRTKLAMSVAPPKRTTVTIDDMYDFPPSQASKDRAMLSLSPPPPHACATTQHGYVNAPPGFVANANNHHTDSVYMPMDLGANVEPSDHMVIQDDIYLPMGDRVSGGSAIYTDMTGAGPVQCPVAPPSTRSYSAAPGTQPPRLQRLTPQNSQDQPMEGYPIHVFSSQRTRSFKRDPSTRSDVHVPLPIRRPGAAVEDSSSSEDEDSDSASSHDKSLDNIVHRQSAPLTLQEKLMEKKSLNSTPPAPQRAGEVQYLDLDLEETAEETERSPVFARSPPAPGSASPTDYKEIDFIKTKALSDVRKDLDTKRKSSEKSLDD